MQSWYGMDIKFGMQVIRTAAESVMQQHLGARRRNQCDAQVANIGVSDVNTDFYGCYSEFIIANDFILDTSGVVIRNTFVR